MWNCLFSRGLPLLLVLLLLLLTKSRLFIQICLTFSFLFLPTLTSPSTPHLHISSTSSYSNQVFILAYPKPFHPLHLFIPFKPSSSSSPYPQSPSPVVLIGGLLAPNSYPQSLFWVLSWWVILSRWVLSYVWVGL